MPKSQKMGRVEVEKILKGKKRIVISIVKKRLTIIGKWKISITKRKTNMEIKKKAIIIKKGTMKGKEKIRQAK